MSKRNSLRIKKIGQSAAKPRIEEGSSTIENTLEIMEMSRVGIQSRSARILNEKPLYFNFYLR